MLNNIEKEYRKISPSIKLHNYYCIFAGVGILIFSILYYILFFVY